MPVSGHRHLGILTGKLGILESWGAKFAPNAAGPTVQGNRWKGYVKKKTFQNRLRQVYVRGPPLSDKVPHCGECSKLQPSPKWLCNLAIFARSLTLMIDGVISIGRFFSYLGLILQYILQKSRFDADTSDGFFLAKCCRFSVAMEQLNPLLHATGIHKFKKNVFLVFSV